MSHLPLQWLSGSAAQHSLPSETTCPMPGAWDKVPVAFHHSSCKLLINKGKIGHVWAPTCTYTGHLGHGYRACGRLLVGEYEKTGATTLDRRAAAGACRRLQAIA